MGAMVRRQLVWWQLVLVRRKLGRWFGRRRWNARLCHAGRPAPCRDRHTAGVQREVPGRGMGSGSARHGDPAAVPGAADGLSHDWQAAVALPPPTYPVTAAMIDQLLVLAVAERPEALGEIVEEHQNFQLRWLQLLSIGRASHPQTFLLMKLMARVGEFAMVQLKLQYPNLAGAAPPPYWYQPRPNQVCATLYPPVPVPGHPAYPAGHALIARLTSDCLTDLLPGYAQPLAALAARVGINRMIAGLHYREDIDAGANTAVALKPFLTACPFYIATFALAQAEWL